METTYRFFLKNPRVCVYYSLLILLPVFFFCSEPEKTKIIDPRLLNSSSTDYFDSIVAANIKKIKVINYYGGVIVTGWSLNDSIRVYLYKTIKTESKKIAEEHFVKITTDVQTVNDTMVISISAPLNQENIYYFSSLSLEIPYQIDCEIVHSDGSTEITALNSNVFVTEAQEVNISNLSGSCDVKASGSIQTNMTLPDSGFCFLTSEDGDVHLNIPGNTSTNLSAKSLYGNVSYSNLNFHQLSYLNNSLTGILGEGEGKIILFSNRGDIIITGLRLLK